MNQIKETFEFKWKRMANWGMNGQTAKFIERWILEKYGWGSMDNYRRAMRKHSIILDAGSGLGRESIRMAKANPEATVVGLELSGCVEEARKHAKAQRLSNVSFFQGDILDAPFSSKQFDFIFCEGVLHHTYNTRMAFKSLCRILKNGGEIAFYVYRKKAPLREYADDYVRSVLQTVSLKEAWKMMEPLTLMAKEFSKHDRLVSIPEDFPALGFKKGYYDLQKWLYNTCFKFFWNDTMSFQENVLVNFDWYAPRFAWRHTEEEVHGWLLEEGLTIIHENIEDAGITIRAVKP